MDEACALRLLRQAMECKKIAFFVTDPGFKKVLLELAASYEAMLYDEKCRREGAIAQGADGSGASLPPE